MERNRVISHYGYPLTGVYPLHAHTGTGGTQKSECALPAYIKMPLSYTVAWHVKFEHPVFMLILIIRDDVMKNLSHCHIATIALPAQNSLAMP